MIIISIALILSGALLGSGITLAIIRRRESRIQKESWNVARLFYTHRNQL